MTNRYLYTLFLRDTGQERDSQQQRNTRNTTPQPLLDQDDSSVARISADPGEQVLNGTYLGEYSEVMAGEMRELSTSAGFDSVPYYPVSGKTDQDGYYTIKSMNVGRVRQESDKAHSYDGRISRTGTRASHYVAIDTAQRSLSNPFGSTTGAELGVPTTASETYWVNPESGASETATVQNTRAAELIDIEIFDATQSTITDPTLVFDLPHDDFDRGDVRVFDDRGVTEFDGNGNHRWQRSFVTDHDFGTDNIVIENGLLRLRFDPGNNSLTAETYDSGTDSWSSKSLGASSWEFDAIDIGHRPEQRLGPTRADAITEWRDTNSASTYKLDFTLRRGQQNARFVRTPDSSSSAPSGLVSLLDPIASPLDTSFEPIQTLRPRSEVTL